MEASPYEKKVANERHNVERKDMMKDSTRNKLVGMQNNINLIIVEYKDGKFTYKEWERRVGLIAKLEDLTRTLDHIIHS